MWWVRRRFLVGMALTMAATSAVLLGGTSALAAPVASAQGPTPEQMAAMSPVQQDAVLHPLNILANALDTVGRTTEAATYAGLELDARTGTVRLRLVDTSRANRFLVEAARQDRTIEGGRVQVIAASHSRQQLDSARDRLLAAGAPAGYQLASIAVAVDGSGLEVGLENVPAARGAAAVPALGPALAGDLGVPVTTVAGHVARAASRFADGKPFIAGERITSGGFGCTSGAPSVGNSGGVYMVTAAHCAHTGDRIGDGNGTFMGNVVDFDTHWDTAVYFVGNNPRTDDNADEFDGPPSTLHILPLSVPHFSFNGQFVCHDGDTSGVLCGIQVDNQDIVECFAADRFAGFCSRGVNGHRSAGTAVRPGDSGGLVFCVCAGSSPVREVRGSVTGPGHGTNGLFWTETLDTYNRFHIHLNPNR